MNRVVEFLDRIGFLFFLLALGGGLIGTAIVLIPYYLGRLSR